MNSVILELENISLAFGGVKALDESVGILGLTDRGHLHKVTVQGRCSSGV